jgi:hypothetical protein
MDNFLPLIPPWCPQVGLASCGPGLLMMAFGRAGEEWPLFAGVETRS